MTRKRVGSLRLRLLAATLVTLALALIGAHVWLGGLFRDHVLRQFDVALVQQLDQVTARLNVDAQGQPQIDASALSDPRWTRPLSGLYWQLDEVSKGGTRQGVLRSRSLWDSELRLEADALADGELHRHHSIGPQGETLRVVERSLQLAESPHARWRLMVAADTRDALVAVDDFHGVLAASLAGLGLLLALAAWAQVAVGLAPLKALQAALVRVREGHTQRLEGRFPTEVQPLVDGFNGVLDRNTEVVERARTQAGNLAHALKTPLAVLDNAASQSTDATLAPLVREQVALANRHIHWHLARARAAATGHLPGQRTALAPLLDGLLRVMGKLYPQRELHADAVPGDCAFAGEGQDLQEMLGNLLDNGCRCARSSVWVGVRHNNTQLQITVEDDGPGIPASQRAEVLLRGVRLDESVPGSGLGLAIVAELAALYGGTITLDENRHGGLSVTLSLPAARQPS